MGDAATLACEDCGGPAVPRGFRASLAFRPGDGPELEISATLCRACWLKRVVPMLAGPVMATGSRVTEEQKRAVETIMLYVMRDRGGT